MQGLGAGGCWPAEVFFWVSGLPVWAAGRGVCSDVGGFS